MLCINKIYFPPSASIIFCNGSSIFSASELNDYEWQTLINFYWRISLPSASSLNAFVPMFSRYKVIFWGSLWNPRFLPSLGQLLESVNFGGNYKSILLHLTYSKMFCLNLRISCWPLLRASSYSSSHILSMFFIIPLELRVFINSATFMNGATAILIFLLEFSLFSEWKDILFLNGREFWIDAHWPTFQEV